MKLFGKTIPEYRIMMLSVSFKLEQTEGGWKVTVSEERVFLLR